MREWFTDQWLGIRSCLSLFEVRNSTVASETECGGCGRHKNVKSFYDLGAQ